MPLIFEVLNFNKDCNYQKRNEFLKVARESSSNYQVF